MRDTNLAQVQAIADADKRPDVNLARAFNPDIIDGQANDIRELKTECARLRAKLKRADETIARQRRHLDMLKLLVGNDSPFRDGATGLLRIEVLSWLLYERDDLVLELDDKPVLIADDTPAGARKVAGFLVSLLCSDGPVTEEMLAMVLRRKCWREGGTGCGHVDCSCGKEPLPLDIPDSVIEAMKEAR